MLSQNRSLPILLNLMSNAIKFTPEGGRVALTARRAGDGSFVFEVSDPGIGIATEDIPRAFAPFEQVDSRLSRQFEGTGLGLTPSDDRKRYVWGTTVSVRFKTVGSRIIQTK